MDSPCLSRDIVIACADDDARVVGTCDVQTAVVAAIVRQHGPGTLCGRHDDQRIIGTEVGQSKITNRRHVVA
jgi:hypothetical protein